MVRPWLWFGLNVCETSLGDGNMFKKRSNGVGVCVAWILGVGMCITMPASRALAVPSLQLDITGGTYQTSDETVISPGPVFTLDALAKDVTSHGVSVFDFSRTYYISAAILPAIGP